MKVALHWCPETREWDVYDYWTGLLLGSFPSLIDAERWVEAQEAAA